MYMHEGMFTNFTLAMDVLIAYYFRNTLMYMYMYHKETVAVVLSHYNC